MQAAPKWNNCRSIAKVYVQQWTPRGWYGDGELKNNWFWSSSFFNSNYLWQSLTSYDVLLYSFLWRANILLPRAKTHSTQDAITATRHWRGKNKVTSYETRLCSSACKTYCVTYSELQSYPPHLSITRQRMKVERDGERLRLQPQLVSDGNKSAVT